MVESPAIAKPVELLRLVDGAASLTQHSLPRPTHRARKDEMGEARSVMRALKEEKDEIRSQLDAMQVC